MERRGQGDRQGHRAQHFLHEAGTTILDAVGTHGNAHVGGSQGKRRHTAVGFDEGTGDAIAVQRMFFYELKRGRGPDVFFRPWPDHVHEDGEIGEAEGEGGTALQERVEATSGVIFCTWQRSRQTTPRRWRRKR